MPYDSYTVLIQDRLIADLAAMTYPDGKKLLGAVKKLIVEIPTQRPFCEVMPTSFEIIQEGLAYDIRRESFYINVYEAIEANATDNEAANVVNRILRIKGRILRYLEKMPDILSWNITGVMIYNVKPTGGNVSVQLLDEGQVLVLQINVTFELGIETR